MSSPQRSERLITTTPTTNIGTALESVKPSILPKLLEGIEIQKISKSGAINPRILTLSGDLFTLFISHHKFGKTESIKDKVSYNGFKAYAKVVGAMAGCHVQTKLNLRVIDVADILFVASGFVASRKVEEAVKQSNGSNGSNGKLSVPFDATKVVTIFHNNAKTIDFMVQDDNERKAVLETIKLIRKAYHEAKVKVGREELLLRYAWYDTDWNKSGFIDQTEFLQLLARINIYLKQEKAIKIFRNYISKHDPKEKRLVPLSSMKSFRGHRSEGASFDECVDILRSIKLEQNEGKIMSDIIFDRIFGAETKSVSAENFLLKFLYRNQNEPNASLADVVKIFSDFDCKDDSMDRLHFEHYLTSSMNDVFDPQKMAFDPETLDAPLSKYWINTSHNTYLMGDQLKSQSSVEMYIIALQRGCKCLEIDCWDDSKTNVPIVYHGFTVTSKIPFQDVISCVNGYIDDHPDTLPIILSLENHCTHSFQEMMARILENTLKERLYIPDGSHNKNFLPSPRQLVGKVVIKGKRPPEKDDDDALTAVDSMEQEFDETVASLDKVTMSDVSSVSGTESQIVLPKICPELARLTLFNGIKYKDFSLSVEFDPSDMHSIAEGRIQKILRTPKNAQLWREYNLNHMTRIYPSGQRVDSSNYSPLVPWAMGCQMVALNFQTDDSPMTLNDGRFRVNGGCGYVLKPQSIISPKAVTPGQHDGVMLKIRVLSGSCLPKPYGDKAGEVIDPYVIVRVHDVVPFEASDVSGSIGLRASMGIQSDWLKTSERKTESIKDNGFSPRWEQTDFFCFPIRSPDVTMLEFVVMDSDKGFVDDTMCKAAIPVSCLRSGVRSVNFFQHGPYGFARILVDVKIGPMSLV